MNMKAAQISCISRNDDDFPELLKEIPSAPLNLYVLGNLSGLKAEEPKIAIVGTRKATEQGRTLAKELAKKLSEKGITIVSGLAMGIDTAAHEGAVAGQGKTIAVLANGLDSIYPRQNENLAKRILEFGGAIISEYPTGTPAYESQFLERNRIVSGLCAATIIIEAPERSGSLVTARLAAEQGREVFVFPGPHNHPNYRGSHKLIRDGARLVASIEDILEDLGLENPNFKTPNPKQIQNSKLERIKDENQLLIIKAVENAGEPLSIDKIIKLTKLEPQTANQTIALLVIEEIIKETERGYSL